MDYVELGELQRDIDDAEAGLHFRMNAHKEEIKQLEMAYEKIEDEIKAGIQKLKDELAEKVKEHEGLKNV
jgi:hypothetical protein